MLPEEFQAGTVLPKDVLQRLLKACGCGVKIYRGSRLVGAERISIGEDSQVDEGVHIFAGEGVTIGRNVHLAFASSISGGGSCALADFVGIGAGVRIITGSEVVAGTGLTNPTVPAEFRSFKRGKVLIEAHAVVFTSSVVLPDVTIGEGAVVAAGSVVHRNLKAWGIYAGNPLVQVGVRPKERILQLTRDFLEGRQPKD